MIEAKEMGAAKVLKKVTASACNNIFPKELMEMS